MTLTRSCLDATRLKSEEQTGIEGRVCLPEVPMYQNRNLLEVIDKCSNNQEGRTKGGRYPRKMIAQEDFEFPACGLLLSIFA